MDRKKRIWILVAGLIMFVGALAIIKYVANRPSGTSEHGGESIYKLKEKIAMGEVVELNKDTFEDTALKSETPVLVDFWAPWCMPCKMLAPTVDQIAAEFAGKVRVVKVDVDSNQALAAKHDIRGIPTLLILKNGHMVDRMVCVQPKNAIAKKLTDLLGA